MRFRFGERGAARCFRRGRPRFPVAMALAFSIILSVALSPHQALADPCAADCNNDGLITREELLQLVNVSLGRAAVSTCDLGGGGAGSADAIVRGVATGLSGCQHVQDQEGLTAAARVATSTMESLDIIDFGFIGAAAANVAARGSRGPSAASGAEAVACDDGNKTVSCTPGDTTVVTTVFAHCRESAITRNGTVVQSITAADACGQIPSNANITLSFEKFSATQDAAGSRSTLSTADLVLDTDRSSAPGTVRFTLSGTLEVSNSGANVERFTQTFHAFVITQAAQADGSTLVTESGDMTVDCLGAVRFDTKVPIRVAAGDACPSGGFFEVALGLNPSAAPAVSGAAAATDGAGANQPTRQMPVLSANDTLQPTGYREFAVRAANGQVYQILQNVNGDAKSKTEDVHITTVVGSAERNVAGCFDLGKVQSVVAAGAGNAFPVGAVRKSSRISDASPPCFNPNGDDGSGSVCIGPECALDCACANGGRCATFTLDALTPLNGNGDGVPGATVDRLVSVAGFCSGFQGGDTYGFGSSVPTTSAGICSTPPDDGFTLPLAQSIYQGVDGSTLILAYPASLITPFATGSAGFAIDANGDNAEGCSGLNNVITEVHGSNSLPQPSVRFAPSGSVAFDFNADKLPDKVLSSCRDVSLSRCAVPPTPSPTAGPPPACQPLDLPSQVPAGRFGDKTSKNTSAGASCGGGGNRAADFRFRYIAPADGFYTIDTIGSQFDTVLYVRQGDCAGPELACNDDRGDGSLQSELGLSLVKGETIIIVVDGFGTQSGQFVLHINSSATPPTPTPTTLAGPALPDLLVTQVSAPGAGSIGGEINVSATVANRGTAEAGAFQVDFLYSADAAITAEDVNSGFGCVFSGLAAGETSTCSGPIGIPSSLPPGSYFVGAFVDLPQQIDESDETNNGRAADTSITISGTPGTPLGTATRTPTRTATQTPGAVTPTQTPTRTPSLAATVTATTTLTATASQLPTATGTRPSTATFTPVATPSVTATRTLTATFTLVATPTATATRTLTATTTRTLTATRTVTPTLGPSLALSPRVLTLMPNGGHTMLTVSLPQPAETPVAVTLAVADTNVATIAPSVTIPAGLSSAQVSVQGNNLGTTTLTASGPGNAAASIYVTSPFAGSGTFVAHAVSVDVPGELPAPIAGTILGTTVSVQVSGGVAQSPISASVVATDISVQVPAGPGAPNPISASILAPPVGVQVPQ